MNHDALPKPPASGPLLRRAGTAGRIRGQRMKVGLVGLGAWDRPWRRACALSISLPLAGTFPRMRASARNRRELPSRHRLGPSQSDPMSSSPPSRRIWGYAASSPGSSGFLEADVKGKLFIEMSTWGPDTVRGLSTVLQMRGGAIGIREFLGSIPTVTEGKLLSLAGGDARDIERARPVLAKLTRAIVHMVPVGSGHTMKLAVNLLMANYLQALAEGLALGVENGLKLDQMLDVFANSPLANGILTNKLPRLRGGPETMTLDLKTLRKDVNPRWRQAPPRACRCLQRRGTLDACFRKCCGLGRARHSQIVSFLRDEMVQRFS